jgi:3-dehydroquinate synthase
MHSKMIIKSKIRDYKLEFIDSFDDINELIRSENTITIMDSNIARLYPQIQSPDNLEIDCTEDAKTMERVNALLIYLAERKANIKTKLIVIGGGVLQDLVGFCASIYCRGIDYVLIPTTLLAQTDSCIGGKTSINFLNKKNILGTFYPPTRILINTNFLKTLNKIDYLSGLGEIYKFHILQDKIKNFNIDNEIRAMIEDGLKYKVDILSKDEFDKGDRRFLNYGHTFGHALESISNHEIPHGLGVIFGCMIATRITHKLNFINKNYDCILYKGIEIIRESKLKLKKEWFDFENLLNIAKSDKKNTGKITMVLVNSKPFLKNIEELELLKESIKETYESI